MTGTAKGLATCAAGAAATALSAAAGLGWPALGALVLLAVMFLAFTGWVISSQARTDRVRQLLYGPPSAPLAQAVPDAAQAPLRRTLTLAPAFKKRRG